MAVVINEFSIVVETDDTPNAGGTPTQAPPLTPLEIAEVVDRRARNELRLFAH